jgi:hypothetical protein
MKKVLILLITIFLILNASLWSLDREPRLPTPRTDDGETFEITVGEARLALYYKELALYRGELIRELEPALILNTMMVAELEKENRWLKVIAVASPLILLAAFILHERNVQ